MKGLFVGQQAGMDVGANTLLMGGNLLGIGVAACKRGAEPIAIQQDKGLRGGAMYWWGMGVGMGRRSVQMQVGSEQGQWWRWRVVEILQPDAVSGHGGIDFLGKRAKRHTVKNGFVSILLGPIADAGGCKGHTFLLNVYHVMIGLISERLIPSVGSFRCSPEHCSCGLLRMMGRPLPLSDHLVSFLKGMRTADAWEVH